jgi:hypothetical protein
MVGRMIARMRSIPVRAFARSLIAISVAGGALVSSGCQTVPTARPEAAAPALQLLESRPLQLAEDCQASGSYFVEFTVRNDGRTDRVHAPDGPACVQQALTAWVESFRYAPPKSATAGGIAGGIASGIEWMVVSARRGS